MILGLPLAYLDDNVEPGEGWLLSEALFPGELWSLSPWLLQWLASSSNSCPDMILSISSSDIFDKKWTNVTPGTIDTSCSVCRTPSLYSRSLRLFGVPWLCSVYLDTIFDFSLAHLPYLPVTKSIPQLLVLRPHFPNWNFILQWQPPTCSTQ